MVPELTYRARASQDGPTATETEVTDGVVCRAPPSLALKPVERILPGSREGLYVARGNNNGTAACGIWFFFRKERTNYRDYAGTLRVSRTPSPCNHEAGGRLKGCFARHSTGTKEMRRHLTRHHALSKDEARGLEAKGIAFSLKLIAAGGGEHAFGHVACQEEFQDRHQRWRALKRQAQPQAEAVPARKMARTLREEQPAAPPLGEPVNAQAAPHRGAGDEEPTAVAAAAAVGAPFAPAGPGISSGRSSSAEGSPVPVNDSDRLIDSKVAVSTLDNDFLGATIVSGMAANRVHVGRFADGSARLLRSRVDNRVQPGTHISGGPRHVGKHVASKPWTLGLKYAAHRSVGSRRGSGKAFEG